MSDRPAQTMDPAELALEWPVITRALEQRAATPMGRALVAQLGALADRAAVEASLQTIAQLRELDRDGSLPGLAGVSQLDALLTRAEKDGVLMPAELISVGRTLEAVVDVRRSLGDSQRRAPRVHALIAELGDHWPLARAIAHTFDPSGLILDDASADLGELRRRASRLRDEAKQRLGELVKGLGDDGVLQEGYFTLRGDRYVVPVRSDRRGQVQGIVHDTSQSGQTLFIEPQLMVDLGNRLKIAEGAVADEELRILRKLCSRLVDHSAQLREDLGQIAVLDSFVARSRFADALEAEAPQLVDGAVLDLHQARHPTLLLASRARRQDASERVAVVANNIQLGGEHRALVISGPNAGGKTVALKTAGLCALMLRAGLPVPALGSSKLGLFGQIHAVVGDAQSIDAQLSTFSAHVLAIDRVVRAVSAPRRRATPTLCLIDEIASGTDPSQGACLGQAMLEALIDADALVIATTHHDRLKALALDDHRFRNASVALDPELQQPTFEIHLDVPGASSAFAIATSLGVSDGLVQRARELAGPEANRLEAHLTDLSRERDQLARARVALEQERAQHAAELQAIQTERQTLRDRERSFKREARSELLGDVRQARREVAEIIAGLQSGRPDLQRADAAAHRLKQLETQVEKRVEKSGPAAIDDAPLERVAVGDRVHLVNLGQDGEVVAVEGQRVTVQVGALRSAVKRRDLRAAQKPQTSARQQRKNRRVEAALQRIVDTPVHAPGAKDPRTRDNTLDLRGQRVEEALENCERFFDAKLRENVQRVFLLHGHGTGALRKALRAELPASAYVQHLAPADEDDGGEAFTVVELE